MPRGHKYTPEQFKFLKKIFKGRPVEESTKMFNRKFRTKLSYDVIRGYAVRHGLRNGLYYNGEKHKIYSEKHINYLRKIVPGRHQSESLKLFNERFGFSLSIKAFSTLYKKHGVSTGFTGCYEKGNVPFNKGKKGFYAPGSEKGWFKKGHKPMNYMPVGSERLLGRGDYIYVKISDKLKPARRCWKAKQVLVWEKANGPVPKGHVVIFLDGNIRNFSLKNLLMIPRSIHAVMCHLNLYTKNREQTKANCSLAQLRVAIADGKRRTFKDVRNKKMAFLDNTGKKVYVVRGEGRDKNRYVAVRETKHGLHRLRAKLKSRAAIGEARRDLCEYASFRGWQRI